MKKLASVAALTLCAVAALSFSAAGAQAPTEGAPVPPPLAATSGILVDFESGKVLWSKDPDLPRPPASLTKILTALVVLEQGNLDDSVVITPEARSVDGGRMFAEQGWTFTLRDLLWGLLLQSGNDAAIALAQKLGGDGGIPAFMEISNARAKELGAHASTFRNPHGLDEPGHISSARDLAVISIASMKNSVFAEMVSSKTHDVPWGNGNPHTFINHNKMLWRYPGTVGIKTGFTAGAGNSLASQVTRDGNTLMAIVLSSPDHYAESIALYDWAFANLPMLRERAAEELKLETAPEPQEKRALEVVQIEDAARSAEDAGRSYPLLAPLAALVMAAGAAVMIRRRRSNHAFASVEEFRQTLDALRLPAQVPPPTSNGSSARASDLILPREAVEPKQRDLLPGERVES